MVHCHVSPKLIAIGHDTLRLTNCPLPLDFHQSIPYYTHMIVINDHSSIQFIMLNNFFQSIFTNCNNYVNSTACDSVHVDAMSGTASVLYKDGSMYSYKNVSRRAIIKFIHDDARSLGKFINNVLLTDRVQCVTVF